MPADNVEHDIAPVAARDAEPAVPPVAEPVAAAVAIVVVVLITGLVVPMSLV